jgi:heme/copper-type cytochrome/quinol oxidase subunit 3
MSAGATRARPNGWWGAALFVASESALFGTLIASYFYLDSRAAQWPPPGITPPKVALPLILTGVLVSTSVPMVLAARAASAGRAGAAMRLVTLAFAVQAAYLAVQVVELDHDLRTFTPRDGGAYASSYYTLLTAHHAHVALGLLLDLWLLSRLALGLNRYRVVAAQVVALYWLFVNAVAVAVVLTEVSPAL